ncbi:MAG: hypothetical protein C0498_04060 [Anaerolinea sp.]|nr:hypothetical protein [Anaerolinea sp.]
MDEFDTVVELSIGPGPGAVAGGSVDRRRPDRHPLPPATALAPGLQPGVECDQPSGAARR